LAEEFAFSNQTAAARDEFQAALKQKPDYAFAHLNLGVALSRLGDVVGALRELEEARRLDPENQMVQSYVNQVRLTTTQK
jgi:Flp pilus assembly protein TadD